MKVAEVLKLIESDGWELSRTRGSHRQYRHPIKRGLVTVAGKRRDDLHPKTLASILRQAGLRNDTGKADEQQEGGKP
jgi:predicted RNA binding protein YcfA (HicA-like mRNA interferase family)